MPSHWSDWRQHLDECRELADEHGVQGGLLLFGEATYTDMVDVTEDLFEAGVFIYWLDSRAHYESYLLLLRKNIP